MSSDVKVTPEDRAKYAPSEIRTPDDAVNAYLRGAIKEDELRKALAVYGVDSLYQPKGERVDAAYEIKLPEDLVEPPTTPYDDYEYRVKTQREKEEAREKAVKAAEKETSEETIKREQAVLANPAPVKKDETVKK